MSAELAGPWLQPQIDSFLEDACVPLRLSTISKDGYPRVISLWYQYTSESLYCVTHQSSKLVRLLEGNSKVGFEISADSPPYHGIRGQGQATLQPLGADPALEQLLTRYVGNLESKFSKWLLSRREEELLIEIKPHRLYSWDYRERMSPPS
ncbi:MAG: nitroimidazol reductase NimA-like FMN-containing flavoprotein [Halioglobus sp.]|jgi:nitroimidazol reductase NimA-like FMN-containing flavoprotein (pyridoxamine 5'-phosphate oxidase superfamily)